jgi:adenylate cyclase
MFSKDKYIIFLNRLSRGFLFNFIFWYISLLFYAYLTTENQIFKVYLNFLKIDDVYYIILVLSIILALMYALVDWLFSLRFWRLFPRQLITLIKSIINFASAFILILAAARLPITTFTKENFTEVLKVLPEMDENFIRFLVYFYVSGFLIIFFREVLKRIGRKNARIWLLGLLNKPMEQERIFMFIDMTKSTTIAEKLGHRKFSHLIQDVFNDMSIVDNYKGQIYNYVGDGAIISWSPKDGLRNYNVLKAYFAFTNLIKKRHRYYQRKYGLTPEFKAGAHIGKVMVLLIGQVKRDISYNGDTINTTARIESVCNEYRSKFLISGELESSFPETKAFRFKHLGNISLKGKSRGVDIYNVTKTTVIRKKKTQKKKK